MSFISAALKDVLRIFFMLTREYRYFFTLAGL
jgi:hypothetical protein